MDTNLAQLSIVPEVTFKTTPDTPAWQILRFKSEDMKADKGTAASEEIRSDRQLSDLAMVSLAAGGGFQYELSYGTYSTLIAAALGTTAVVVNQTGVMSLDDSSETLTKIGVKATGLLTGTDAPSDGEEFVIGAKTYVAKTALTAPETENEVLIGISLATFLDNLKAAVNDAGGTPGTDYGSDTTANATVTATTNTATTQAFEAITAGTAGNLLATTTDAVDLSWGATTLTGGEAATWTVTPIAGQFIKVTGSATAANNGVKLVVSVSASVITCAAGSFTADTVQEHITIRGTAYKNGVSLPSFSIERKTVNQAAADYFQRYAGMGVNEWSLNIVTGKIATGAFQFTGSTPSVSDAAIAGATYAAATTSQVQNATSHVTRIYLDGALNTEHLMGLEFTINNNLRAKPEVGSATPFELGNGEFNASGKVDAYFKDNGLYQKMIEHTYAAVAWFTQDTAGNGMGFHFPKISYNPADPNVSGKNNDIMLNLPFQAIMDPVSGSTFVFTEIPAA